jgi:DNA invertase Pin-like site-specific DNA recombinase
VYARVSTTDQTCDTQLLELRAYIHARGWQSTEFVDGGHSGAKESRPALDALMKAVHRRQVDVVVVVALDRLGRSLSHLVRIIEDWQRLGVSLLSLRDGLDLSSASGRLQLHILAALAEFERGRIRERVLAGLHRAKAQGRRLGRPTTVVPVDRVQAVRHLPVEEAADVLGVSRSTVKRWRGRVQQSLSA